MTDHGEGGAHGAEPERQRVANEASQRRAAQQRIAAEILGHGGSYNDAGVRAWMPARSSAGCERRRFVCVYRIYGTRG